MPNPETDILTTSERRFVGIGEVGIEEMQELRVASLQSERRIGCRYQEKLSRLHKPFVPLFKLPGGRSSSASTKRHALINAFINRSGDTKQYQANPHQKFSSVSDSPKITIHDNRIETIRLLPSIAVL
ncbi:hypothetical protein K402DRAFT_272370 [Aulographum hederae CBS 113979]|uniref:Uncharacterized protein n=1 Tax=Aulographum hederae CBS 113979 TaxID=1176131 RepID=A0A6G1H880_9PEZI|nr:hypothetical protein K402DRAFT_272370 [Aulographum hederae CBS 113979]